MNSDNNDIITRPSHAPTQTLTQSLTQCICCNYFTLDKSKMKRHLNTKKHILNSTSHTKYDCSNCEYINTNNKKGSLQKHLLSQKHINNTRNSPIIDNTGAANDDIIKNIVRQNQIIQTEILNTQKTQNELLTKILNTPPSPPVQIINNHHHNQTNNQTNTVNNTFNLNIFLNEKCKDAITIEDFIANMIITEEQTNDLGEYGFVKGITNIITSNLLRLNLNQRPLHCSDIKRQHMYIKNNDGWIKDETLKMTKNIVSKTKNRNFAQFYKNSCYSSCTDLDSSEFIQAKMVYGECIGGPMSYDIDYLYKQNERVLRNIINYVSIDKDTI